MSAREGERESSLCSGAHAGGSWAMALRPPSVEDSSSACAAVNEVKGSQSDEDYCRAVAADKALDSVSDGLQGHAACTHDTPRRAAQRSMKTSVAVARTLSMSVRLRGSSTITCVLHAALLTRASAWSVRALPLQAPSLEWTPHRSSSHSIPSAAMQSILVWCSPRLGTSR